MFGPPVTRGLAGEAGDNEAGQSSTHCSVQFQRCAKRKEAQPRIYDSVRGKVESYHLLQGGQLWMSSYICMAHRCSLTL